MDPFLGEIRIFGGTFAPRGWALCNGQLLPINQNQVLFSLLGTTYGGDGRTTFALPDLRGRAPAHQGQGSGLSPLALGQAIGAESVAIIGSQVPVHTHTPAASTAAADQSDPTGNVWANGGEDAYTTNLTGAVRLDASAIGSAGGNAPHENRPPFLGLSFIIALQGIYPSRT